MPVSSSSISMPILERPAIRLFCLASFGKDEVMRGGPHPAEQRGPQNQAGQQLPDHRRLAEALHDLAESDVLTINFVSSQQNVHMDIQFHLLPLFVLLCYYLLLTRLYRLAS